MSGFVRDLRNSVAESLGKGAVWGDINPLVVIGLTTAMLDLGLTEDQMHKVVRSYSRQLAGQIHPDKKVGNVSEERQRQINQAFDFLDNRENFSRAMAEFRTLHSDERNEVKILTGALTRTREELEVLRGRELGFAREQAQLERDREQFERERAPLQIEIPRLNQDLQNQYLLSERHYRRAKGWKHRHDTAMSYINSLSADPKQLGVGVHAFEARWMAVASFISAKELKPYRASWIAFGPSGKLSPVFIEATKKLGMSKGDIAGIARIWKKWFAEFGKKSTREFRRHYSPCLTLLSLSAGKPTPAFGWGAPFLKGRVIGALPSERMRIEHAELTAGVNREAIFEWISPSLTPEGLIVLQVLTREQKYVSGGSLKFMSFDTKHLILGVG